ncbi:12685_t:CDS:2, partial [Acaulospora morrowiae]
RTLAATAEIPLAGIYAGKILFPSQLPIRMVGFGRAFRAEAGARGQDAKGLYRVHQFSKVEIFCLTRPEESDAMLNEIVSIQEEIFCELELILDMPTYELGASAYRKFDIEAWMPGRGRWGEISSASNCTDYQSRRLNIRYKPSISLQEQVGNNANNIAGQKAQQTLHTEFVHTLNGTAIAVPRMIIAILENFQRDDGKVTIPKVLRNWMCGMKEIG